MQLYPCMIVSCVRVTTDALQKYTQSNGRRPFGLSTLIMGFDYDKTPHLYQTDPSGTYFEWKVCFSVVNLSSVVSRRLYAIASPKMYFFCFKCIHGQIPLPILTSLELIIDKKCDMTTCLTAIKVVKQGSITYGIFFYFLLY